MNKTIVDIHELVKADLDLSAIDEETARLNFFPINGPGAFDELYHDRPDRINSGALNRFWMDRWHKMDGFRGWYCNGRVKRLDGPHFPNSTEEKPIRYMSRLGFPTPITFIEPGARAIALAERRFGIEKPAGMDYWEWVKFFGLAIVITEGEKKAASLVCLGIPAISLPGIYTGFNTIRDDWGQVVERLLRGELREFDSQGRSICIIFDSRPNVAFVESVEFRAASMLSRQFQYATIRVAELPQLHKGIDDYIYAREYDIIDKVMREAQSAMKMEHARLWQKYREYTSNTLKGKTRDYFFDAPAPEHNRITVVRSNLNSGKSEWVANAIAKIQTIRGRKKATADGVMLSLGHRNSLQEQICTRWDFDHLNTDLTGSSSYRFSDPNLKVALCFDSLLKLPVNIFDNATVIIDESMTAIKHLLTSSTLRGKRLQILERFQHILKVSDRIVLLDGFMANWMVEYIEAVAPGKGPAIKYENESNREAPPVYFLDDNNVKRKQLESYINSQILAATLPAVVVDSIIKAEAIAQQLQILKGDGLLITSKTVTEKWARDFLKNPDEYIEKNTSRVSWIVCTPTVESGVSIASKGKFDTVFCWFVGVVGINEAVQMSRRVRNPERIVVYAPKTGIARKRQSAAFENVLMEDLELRIEAEAGMFANSTIGDKVQASLENQLRSPHIRAWAKMQAIEHLETRNYREFLFTAFENMGMKPIRVEAEACDNAAYQESKAEVQMIECQQIFVSATLTDYQAEQLGKKLDANWAERCSLLKYKILQRLPGLAESKLWSADFIHRLRYRERNLNSQLEMFWILTHPAESKALKAQQWAGKVDVDFFIPDRVGADRWLLCEVLNKLGFRRFLDGERFSDQDERVLEFCANIRRRKTISAITGHPGNQRLGFLGRELFPMFGIKTQKRQVRLPAPAIGVEGARVWFHWYDPILSHPENWAELMSYCDRGFQKRLDVDAQSDLNVDSECVAAILQVESTLPPKQETSQGDRTLGATFGGLVRGLPISIKIEAESEILPQNLVFSDSKIIANLTPYTGSESQDLVLENKHPAEKPGDDESDALVEVGVKGFGANPDEVHPAILLGTAGDGFKIAFNGIEVEIPADSLVWNFPPPS